MMVLGHESLPFTDSLIHYAFPSALAGALAGVVATSEVGINLWIIGGIAAEGLVWMYCGLLLASMYVKAEPRLHEVGVVLGVFILVGRSGSFLELVLQDRVDLIGAVLERIVIMVALIIWHSHRAAEASIEKAMRKEP